DDVRAERVVAVIRVHGGDPFERQEVVEPEIADARLLSPRGPPARIAPSRRTPAHAREDGARVAVGLERPQRPLDRLGVEGVERAPLAERRNQHDEDDEGEDRASPAIREETEAAPDPLAAEPDEEDRREMDRADESMERERVAEREDADEISPC